MVESKVVDGKQFEVVDKREDGFYCIYCKRFSKEVVMDERGLWDKKQEDGSTLVYKKDYKSITPVVKEVWRVFLHYDGCRGWD